MTTTDERPQFRALDMLLKEYEPRVHRRAPYKRPKPPTMWRDVMRPAWTWYHASYDPQGSQDVTYLDRIASWPSASASASYAHGELTHTGALPGEGKHPGYYLVDAHSWQDERIVSPLGTADMPDRVWIAYPTLELLQQLSRLDDAPWPGVTIHDSWTSAVTCRMRPWATAVNNRRVEAMREVQRTMVDGTEAEQAEAYDYYENVIKAGYAMAFQLMRGTEHAKDAKSELRRPDWFDTTVAQAAASVWRDTWKTVQAGYQPLFMGAKDEVAWKTEDVRDFVAGMPPLIKMDQTGVSLGHWKVKPRTTEGATE